LVTGDDNTLMNKLAIAVNGDGAERGARPETADPTRKKAPAQSHIRAARPKAPPAKLPEDGPMAAMLRKVLGKKDE
jgi:PTH1 family peptidyl-tRNA hydrolase